MKTHTRLTRTYSAREKFVAIAATVTIFLFQSLTGVEFELVATKKSGGNRYK